MPGRRSCKRWGSIRSRAEIGTLAALPAGIGFTPLEEIEQAAGPRPRAGIDLSDAWPRNVLSSNAFGSNLTQSACAVSLSCIPTVSSNSRQGLRRRRWTPSRQAAVPGDGACRFRSSCHFSPQRFHPCSSNCAKSSWAIRPASASTWPTEHGQLLIQRGIAEPVADDPLGPLVDPGRRAAVDAACPKASTRPCASSPTPRASRAASAGRSSSATAATATRRSASATGCCTSPATTTLPREELRHSFRTKAALAEISPASPAATSCRPSSTSSS